MTNVRRQYSKDFKVEAVTLVTTQGYSIAETAKRLGINAGMLSRWKQEQQTKKADAFPGNGNQSGLEKEIQLLRSELRRTQMERDILKKATVFFARESL